MISTLYAVEPYSWNANINFSRHCRGALLMECEHRFQSSMPCNHTHGMRTSISAVSAVECCSWNANIDFSLICCETLLMECELPFQSSLPWSIAHGMRTSVSVLGGLRGPSAPLSAHPPHRAVSGFVPGRWWTSLHFTSLHF